MKSTWQTSFEIDFKNWEKFTSYQLNQLERIERISIQLLSFIIKTTTCYYFSSLYVLAACWINYNHFSYFSPYLFVKKQKGMTRRKTLRTVKNEKLEQKGNLQYSLEFKFETFENSLESKLKISNLQNPLKPNFKSSKFDKRLNFKSSKFIIKINFKF